MTYHTIQMKHKDTDMITHEEVKGETLLDALDAAPYEYRDYYDFKTNDALTQHFDTSELRLLSDTIMDTILSLKEQTKTSFKDIADTIDYKRSELLELYKKINNYIADIATNDDSGHQSVTDELRPNITYTAPLATGHLNIIARPDPDYPGLDIQFIPYKPTCDHNYHILIEQPIYDTKHKNVNIAIWNDPAETDCAHEIELKNTEEK